MNTKRSCLLSLFMLFSFSSIPMYPASSANDWQETGSFIAKVGAAIVGIGAATVFCSWLFSESYEQILNNAQRKYNETQSNYQEHVILFKRLFNTERYKTICEIENNKIKKASEPALYELAVALWSRTSNFSTYFNELEHTISELESHKHKLNKSIQSLGKKNNNHGSSIIRNQMVQLSNQIESLIPYLSLLRCCGKHHAGYFALFASEGLIRERYKGEFTAFANYPHDRYMILQEIKLSIMTRATKGYPYLEYVSMIDADIHDIKKSLQNVSYNYDERISWARRVLECLEYIKGLVMIEDAYKNELDKREKDRIKKEQIAIMREQARTEKEKLQELKEQNRIERKKLRQKEREYFDTDTLHSTEIRIHL